MKLKKIASLALAGVMAVSMLAGCSTGTGNGDNSGVTVGAGATSVVGAVNDGQSSGNDVKITFTSDAKLENALKVAVEMYGDTTAMQQNLWETVCKLTGIDPVENFTDLWGKNPAGHDFATAVADDDNKSRTYLAVAALPATSEEAALKMVADAMDEMVGELVNTTYVEGTTGSEATYFNYDYKGSVVMISAETSNGVTFWYVAGTITQTVDAKKQDK